MSQNIGLLRYEAHEFQMNVSAAVDSSEKIEMEPTWYNQNLGIWVIIPNNG